MLEGHLIEGQDQLIRLLAVACVCCVQSRHDASAGVKTAFKIHAEVLPQNREVVIQQRRIQRVLDNHCAEITACFEGKIHRGDWIQTFWFFFDAVVPSIQIAAHRLGHHSDDLLAILLGPQVGAHCNNASLAGATSAHAQSSRATRRGAVKHDVIARHADLVARLVDQGVDFRDQIVLKVAEIQ